jgi:uncharacterized membrane protein
MSNDPDQWGPPDVEADIEHAASDQALIGLSFSDKFRAQEFLTAMTRLASVGSLKLRDAVVVSKDDSGDVKVQETIDPTPGRSALSGAMWTGLIGLIVGGPVGWVAGLGLGAGAGAITAKVVDLGIPDEWVEWFRAAVHRGTTTVVILAEDVDLGALEQEVRRFAGAELLHSTLPAYAIDLLRDALGERRDEPSDEWRGSSGSPDVVGAVPPAPPDESGGPDEAPSPEAVTEEPTAEPSSDDGE